MVRVNIINALGVLALVFVMVSGWPCPYANYRGNVFSDQVIIALGGGTISIQDDLDTQCYNYVLPYSFTSVPDIAISVFELGAQASNSIYFYIKPKQSNSLISIPFIVRTQASYTQWNHITFSFIAEDRNDIESGYYLVDSGALAGCEVGKYVQVILPFRSKFSNGVGIKHSLFLHGFQISTIKTGGGRSPFQLQIVSSIANVSGIVTSLAVSTITTVNSIYISYIAFQSSTLSIVGGGFVYDIVGNPSSTMYYAPQNNIPRNFARLFGVTGFIINYQYKKINMTTKWDGYAFSFNLAVGNSGKAVQYFSFSFIFFTGSECQDCVANPIFYNSTCISTCPVGTALAPDGTCINCGAGRQWNGTACVIICPTGQYLNPVTNNCECPPTLNWDGSNCVSCYNGKTWNINTKMCQCAAPLQWNGYTCANVICTNGKILDVYTYSCQCPDTTYWNGMNCMTLPQCQGGQVLDSNYQCNCQNGYVWSQNSCIYSPCVGGQIWTGTQCVCPAGLNFNGSMCLQCINGQKWDVIKSTCSCDSGYQWNGQYCDISASCSAGRVWDASYQQCVCASGYYWSGYSCLVVQKCNGGQYFDTSISKCICLSGFQWNGKLCIQCSNGAVWNVTSLSCTCPMGTVSIQNSCVFQQQCTGGKQWNQNSWSCECPTLSVWNGNFCIQNPCTNGRMWNDSIKSCQCTGNKMWINQSCVPPQIACTNGKVWSSVLYACQCPDMTYQGPTSCLPIPVCPGGQVYNPLYSNQCQCSFGMSQTNGICTSQKCPTNQFYNLYSCQVINCPPPTFFQNGKCTLGGSNQCQFGYTWNGIKCVFTPIFCPSGTTWSNLSCISNTQCGNGFYGNTGNCLAFPQRCIPPSKWDGTKCSIIGTSCPLGSYSQGNLCIPYTQCQNGYVWDSNYLRCLCPPGMIDNGQACIACLNGQQWSLGFGCGCPDGLFDTGTACTSVDTNRCSALNNAIWSNNKCQCRPGFIKVGLYCVCYGTQTGSLCDRCSYKPNSIWVGLSGLCQCKAGFIQVNEQCVPSNQIIMNYDPVKCSPGTYFDGVHKMCVGCSSGCLSCVDCYTCNVCLPQFYYNPYSQTCVQLCGDGLRYSLDCDDGNNIDGDGCSRDCKIEGGYQCTGGSPSSSDSCYYYTPNQISFQTMGQIRMSSSVLINIKLNYLPQQLLTSSDCSNQCNKFIKGQITSGDTSSISITSQYLPGSNYLFIINVQFGKALIAPFNLNVGINQNYMKYFGNIPVMPCNVPIQPAQLSAVSDVDTLS